MWDSPVGDADASDGTDRSRALPEPRVTAPHGRATPTPPREDSMDISITDQLLSTTRAVRRRLDLERPVEREVVLECLRLAVQAPTAGNQQSWRWLVLDEPDVRAKVADLYTRRTLPVIERRYPRLNNPQTKRVYDSARYLATVLPRVPVLIVPCVAGRPEGPPSHIRPRSTARSFQRSGICNSHYGLAAWVRY